jgi:hypothetical protein
MDFVKAREKRREVLAILRQQQAEEASCVKDIKSAATQGKRDLLWAIANWLTSISPGQPVNRSTRSLFGRITTRVTLDDWLSIDAELDDAVADLSKTKEQELRTVQELEAVAPWGFLSSMFAEDSKKAQIRPLEARRDTARSVRERAESRMATARHKMHNYCDLFLRGACRPDQLQLMCEEL